MQRALNAHIPRGSLEQKLFRARVWHWQSRGHFFDESVSRTSVGIRRESSGIAPLSPEAERAPRAKGAAAPQLSPK
jgi:hypothetical protein